MESTMVNLSFDLQQLELCCVFNFLLSKLYSTVNVLSFIQK